MQYSYQSIANDPLVPWAPILRVQLFNPEQENDRVYELDAFLDTGADCTLIPLEAVSVLRLAFRSSRTTVNGVGSGVASGFLCKIGLQLGEQSITEITVVACESAAIGQRDQMIIGRDILNLCCIKFDGRRQQFSFEES